MQDNFKQNNLPAWEKKLLKDLVAAQKAQGNMDELHEIRSILHKKNGISNYFIKLDGKNYKSGLEDRISDYVRLYTSFINAG